MIDVGNSNFIINVSIISNSVGQFLKIAEAHPQAVSDSRVTKVFCFSYFNK